MLKKSYPSTVSAPVAFIGLGTMGYPMAGHLQKAGHEVCVFNRTKAKAEAWQKEFQGKTADTPKDAASGAQFVFLCVGNDDDVRSVVYGENGVLAGMAPGSILVDHTTTSAELAREIAEKCSERGVSFVDAPVTGGESGAQQGTLSVLCGGDELTVNFIRPIVAAYASSITRIGPVGHGQLAKMVNQICIAGCVQGLAEALAFGQRSGINMEKVLAAIGSGAASSWQMNNRGMTMLEGKFDFGFAVDWMRKDLGIVLDEASRNGADLSVTKTVDGFYKEVQEMGGGRLDTSSLILRLLK
jgi:3-hydroxyisobutyrate dehydrogenase-like beta-hydroxyacid dehydrogenase